MRYLFVLIALAGSYHQAPAQRMIDREGEVVFFSEAPLEDILATNRQAMAILDPESREVAVSMLIRGFEFDKSLMQQHFNENYMESDKFPKATFTGQINDFNTAMLSGEKQEAQYNVIGELTIHGVTRPLNTQVAVRNSGNVLHVTAKFIVKVADHDIEIPTLVIKNIAEEVEVTANFEFNINE